MHYRCSRMSRIRTQGNTGHPPTTIVGRDVFDTCAPRCNVLSARMLAPAPWSTVGTSDHPDDWRLASRLQSCTRHRLRGQFTAPARAQGTDTSSARLGLRRRTRFRLRAASLLTPTGGGAAARRRQGDRGTKCAGSGRGMWRSPRPLVLASMLTGEGSRIWTEVAKSLGPSPRAAQGSGIRCLRIALTHNTTFGTRKGHLPRASSCSPKWTQAQ